MWAMLSSVQVFGMGAVLDRGVLGRQAEGVPAERMQHVEAAHPLHARDDVADHVVADVADVRVPRRVGEHLEAVELRLGRVLGDLEGRARPPAVLPLLLDCLGLVVGHDLEIISHASKRDWAARTAASARSPRGAGWPVASSTSRRVLAVEHAGATPRGTRAAPAGRSRLRSRQRQAARARRRPGARGRFRR